jgi:RES domain-containing protein
MASQVKHALRLWRVGHGQYPLWSGEGARLYGGRWSPKGCAVIYTCENYSLCILEILANLKARRFPSNFVRSEMEIPAGVSVERVDISTVPGWDHPSDLRVPQGFGEQWVREARSLLLYVPSVVVEGLEWNVVINPNHPEFKRTRTQPPSPVQWDTRLLR